MTSKRRHFLACPTCGTRINQDTAFSRWLRALPYPNDGSQVSCHNLDYIWFRFYDNWFITIEEKTNGKEYADYKSDLSQIQSHGLISQMLQYASGHKFDISFGNWKRYESVEFRGHYLVVFQKTGPDDSEWIKINGETHDKNDLLLLLEYGQLVNLSNAAENLVYTSLVDFHDALLQKLSVPIDLSIAVSYFKEETNDRQTTN